MKKLAIAAFMLVTFAGASFAQTTPKKTKAADKMEKKESKTAPSASSDTTGHKHMHKGTKHKA